MTVSALPPPLAIFGLGTGELVAIFALILLLFGAKRLPDLARGLGKSIREFKKAASEAENDIREAVEEQPKSGSSKPPAALPPSASNN